MDWSHIATYLDLLVLLLSAVVGATLFKKLVVSNRIGMKFGRTVLQVNTHQLTESEFWYDIILSRRWPWRLPATHCHVPTECARCHFAVCATVPDQQYFCAVVIQSVQKPTVQCAIGFPVWQAIQIPQYRLLLLAMTYDKSHDIWQEWSNMMKAITPSVIHLYVQMWHEHITETFSAMLHAANDCDWCSTACTVLYLYTCWPCANQSLRISVVTVYIRLHVEIWLSLPQRRNAMGPTA